MTHQPAATSLSCFAITAPGLEPLAERELRALGHADAAAAAGGVAFTATRPELYRANLWLRTTSRVVVRVAEFRARTFFELERQAARVPWDRFVGGGGEGRVRFRVTSRKSKLYHTGAVAERLAAAAEKRTGAAVVAGGAPPEDDAEGEGDEAALGQLFVVRVAHDVCTVSADSSGALLHRRGYRQRVAKAPLRETLAAAMLAGAEWDGRTALLDPMCGSGTIPIEAALVARRLAPGRDRDFAFTRWPDFRAADWRRLLQQAAEQALPASPVPIHASDRDAGAVEATRENARRAGVEQDLALAVRPLSAAAPSEGLGAVPERGLVVTNPPYGARIGDSRQLRNLYAALGALARNRLPGWTLAVLSADRALESQLGAAVTEVFRTSNGGIPVRLVVAR
jgi:putative N6-adenine-specific DNA methylase